MSRRVFRYSSVKQRGDVQKWKDKLVNFPVFILGNGPSLNDEDIASLSSYLTIGINRSFLKLDTTILLWQDASFWYTERKKLLELEAIKYCTASGDPENRFCHFNIKPNGFRLPENPGLLHGTGASGPLAVQLAYILGCNPIILLGYDCKPRGENTDFYGINRFHSPSTIPQCLSGLSWIKSEVHDTGVRNIISCSENDYFERISLKVVLSSIDDKYRQPREYWNQFLK